jgi:hypothetical protein
MVKLVMHQFHESKYIKSFLDFETEICAFFKTAKANPIIKTVFDFMRNFGKIPSRCPIKKV